MFCWKCGKEIDNDAVFCVHCGVAVNKQAEHAQTPVINIVNTNTNTNMNAGVPRVQKSKWTAFWLCLLLGIFGAHRFYVGKAGTAIIWILTGGLFGIGLVVDLIMILCGGFRDKSGQFLV